MSWLVIFAASFAPFVLIGCTSKKKSEDVRPNFPTYDTSKQDDTANDVRRHETAPPPAVNVAKQEHLEEKSSPGKSTDTETPRARPVYSPQHNMPANGQREKEVSTHSPIPSNTPGVAPAPVSTPAAQHQPPPVPPRTEPQQPPQPRPQENRNPGSVVPGNAQSVPVINIRALGPLGKKVQEQAPHLDPWMTEDICVSRNREYRTAFHRLLELPVISTPEQFYQAVAIAEYKSKPNELSTLVTDAASLKKWIAIDSQIENVPEAIRKECLPDREAYVIKKIDRTTHYITNPEQFIARDFQTLKDIVMPHCQVLERWIAASRNYRTPSLHCIANFMQHNGRRLCQDNVYE